MATNKIILIGGLNNNCFSKLQHYLNEVEVEDRCAILYNHIMTYQPTAEDIQPVPFKQKTEKRRYAKRFTEEQIVEIREIYKNNRSTRTIKELSVRFNRTVNSIRFYLRK